MPTDGINSDANNQHEKTTFFFFRLHKKFYREQKCITNQLFDLEVKGHIYKLYNVPISNTIYHGLFSCVQLKVTVCFGQSSSPQCPHSKI